MPTKDRIDPRKVDIRMRLIELEHIESGTGRLIGESTSADAVSLKTVFRPGDILFGKLRSYLRKYWLADSDGLCSTEIWALRARGAHAGAFLRYVVESDRFIEVASGGYGTHMPRADWGVIRKFVVLTPPPDEQRAIAKVLQDADYEIETLRQRLAKVQDVKTGMTQQLLTGRTRLPVKEAAA
jgi:type I restriction enzyme S subunit